MFAPPPEVTARLFARVPERFQLRGRHSDWLFGKRTPEIGSFLESPIVDADGSILVSDIPFGRIFRVGEDGSFVLVAEYDGEPNGLARSKDGRIWIADHRNGLLRLDPRCGAVEPVLPRLRREGFKGLNDVILGPEDTLYFTDQGQTGMHDPTGRVFARRKDGSVHLLIDTVPSPNGMAFSPDGQTLYLAVTRANQVWRLPLHADGSTTKVNIFLQLSGGHTGPDGLATDRDGNLYVCHSGMGCVWVFNELGVPISKVNVPEGLEVTSACFAGAGGDSLFVVESSIGAIFRIERDDIPGVSGAAAESSGRGASETAWRGDEA